MGGRGFSCCGRNQIIYVLMDGFINMFLLLFCIARVESFIRKDWSFIRKGWILIRKGWSLSRLITRLFVYDHLSVRLRSLVYSYEVICPWGLCHFDTGSFADMSVWIMSFWYCKFRDALGMFLGWIFDLSHSHSTIHFECCCDYVGWHICICGCMHVASRDCQTLAIANDDESLPRIKHN